MAAEDTGAAGAGASPVPAAVSLGESAPVSSAEPGAAPSGRAARLTAGLAAAVFVAGAVVHSLLDATMMDDAYISFRYSRNVANGLGFVFNPGERVEGYTNFLWVVLGAVAEAAGVPSALVLPALGVLLGVVLVVVVSRGASFPYPALADNSDAANRAPNLWAGAAAACLVCCHPGLLFYAGTGLETVCFAFLTTAGLVAAAQRRAFPFVLATAAAFLTRPEAGLLGLLGTGWFVLTEAPQGRLRRALGLVLGFAVTVGPYLVWKLAYFGSLLPLTVIAKTPVPAQAVAYAAESAWPTALLAIFVTSRAFARARGDAEDLGLPRGATPQPASPARLYLAFWWATLLSLCFVGPDWMPAGRLLAPAFPALAMAAGPELARVVREARVVRVLAAAAVLVFVAHSAYQNHDLFRRFRGRSQGDQHIAKLVLDLEKRGVRSIATVNIGLIGYVAPDVRILDLVGLTDAHIGRLPGAHLRKEPSQAYLAERAADAYILTSSHPIGSTGGQSTYTPDFHVENHVFRMPWFRTEHRYVGTLPLGANYFYHVFVRAPLLQGFRSP